MSERAPTLERRANDVTRAIDKIAAEAGHTLSMDTIYRIVRVVMDALAAGESPAGGVSPQPGDVYLVSGRLVRVSGMPDGRTLCRNHKRYVAVRNVEGNRLSYVPEGLLRSLPVQSLAPVSPVDVRTP